MPAGAKVISTKIVPKGTIVTLYVETYIEKERYQTNKGSATYTRHPVVPTYAEWDVTRKRNVFGALTEDKERVTYEIKKWVEGDKSGAAISTGNETEEPIWTMPIVNNADTRTGRRTEFYSVILVTISGEPKEYNRQVSFEEWQRYKKGQKVKAVFLSPNGQPVTFTLIN